MQHRYPSGVVARWHGDTAWRSYPSGREFTTSRTIRSGDTVSMRIEYPSGAHVVATWLRRGDSARLVMAVDSMGRARMVPATEGRAIRARLLMMEFEERAVWKQDEEFRVRNGLPPRP
jgi:hypothetical protein